MLIALGRTTTGGGLVLRPQVLVCVGNFQQRHIGIVVFSVIQHK